MRSKLCLLFIYSHQHLTFLSVTGDSIFYNCMNPFLFQLHSGQLLWFSHTVNEMTDHTVSTCIRPVILRFQSGICQMIAAEIDHIPWTINIHISKPVAVIPLFHCLIIFFLSIIPEEFLYFRICKSKCFIKTLICNGINRDMLPPLKSQILKWGLLLSQVSTSYPRVSRDFFCPDTGVFSYLLSGYGQFILPASFLPLHGY